MNKTKEKGKNRSQKADFSHQTSENGIIGFKKDFKMVDIGT